MSGATDAPTLSDAPAAAGALGVLRVRFGRSRLHRLGLLVAKVLFLGAALAPLLANHAPLLFAGEGGLQFPAFAELQPEDVGWLGAALAAVPLLRLVRRGRFRAAVITALLGALLITAAVAATPRRLHPDRWSHLAQGQHDVFFVPTPLRFGPRYGDSMEHWRKAPSPRHLLGTDDLGRDLLARLLHGSRVSLIVGFVAMALALLIGLTLGCLAGYAGGWVDLSIMRLIEVFLCFPPLFLLVILFAWSPGSAWLVMASIGLLSWTGVARLSRGEFLRLKNLEFVIAARALGASHLRIVLRHLLPNAMAPVLVATSFGIAGAILAEASLSFLGLGMPQGIPTWGRILHEGKGMLDYAPWLALAPGAVIFLAVTSYNLVGEGLRDALDPRLKR